MVVIIAFFAVQIRQSRKYKYFFGYFIGVLIFQPIFKSKIPNLFHTKLNCIKVCPTTNACKYKHIPYSPVKKK